MKNPSMLIVPRAPRRPVRLATLCAALVAALCAGALVASCSNFNDFQDALGTRVYTVAFDSGDATTPAVPASMTVTSPATTLSALPTDPARTGYDFGGWYSEPNGAGTAFTSATTVNANCTVHAKWTPISYSITWHLNEGTLSTPNPANYTIESPAIVFGEPTRDAYYFAGWYDNESCSGDAVTQLAAGSTGAKEYWAKWSLIPVYTVTFDSGTATTPASPASMTVTSPATTLAALPTDPARTGYDFGGWYSEPDGEGTAFTSATTVSANCTVHAKWTPISYSITWHLNEGTLASPNPVSYTIESPAIVFGEPSRDAYYFAGWYDNEACTGDAVSELATGSTGAKEYWAKWVTLYSITFNANGGTGSMDPQVLGQGQTAALTANGYTCNGFNFLGWSTNATATSAAYSDGADYTMPSSNVTLYAIWQYTGTTLATLSSESTASVSMAAVASTDTDGYLLAHDGSAYVQETSTSGGFEHRITPFTMAQYEVTYELWYTVRSWAQANGYSFGNLGREGSQGTDGAEPTVAGRLRPVTVVSWRDAMVWCNAYSEMAGRVPYYYSDAAYLNLIKTATNSTTVTASTAGSQDAPFINPNGTGYRLPTEGEWQYAASCGGIYPYNYASGADAVYDATSGGSDIDGDGELRYSVDVAWYYDNSNSLGSSHPDFGTHPAGTKAPNALGLYDMSGNVYERCFDWYGSTPSSAQEDYSGPATGSSRLLCGGSWRSNADVLQVGNRSFDSPYNAYISLGFRLVEDL